MNKKILIIISIVIIAILEVIVFITYERLEEEKRIEIEEDATALTLKENLNTEFLSKVKPSNFIFNLNGELLNDDEIETTSLGEKEVEIKYKNSRNKIKTKSFKINIVDTTRPRVYIQSIMTVPIGYSKDIAYTVLSGDECDSNPTREIVGEYNTNQVGSYNLQYVIKDASGNEERKNFVLKVVPKEEVPKATSRERVFFSECIEKYKNGRNSFGIDVSKWQGDIDWNAVKDAGAEFVFIRLAHQDGFEGDYGLDKYFKQNIEGAINAGIKVRSVFL